MPVLLPLAGIRSLRMPVAGVFVRIGLLGVGATRYREMARAFATELVQRPRIFIRDGIATMRRHLVDGDRVVIVTGCEQTLVRAIFESIGLHDLEIIASRLREGRLGMRKDVHNIGARKPEQIAAHGLGETWDIAYSDSSRDIPMLRPAREAVLVNAGSETVKRVERALGRPLRRVDWF
jgi:phosphatidylglycerophosphatase C